MGTTFVLCRPPSPEQIFYERKQGMGDLFVTASGCVGEKGIIALQSEEDLDFAMREDLLNEDLCLPPLNEIEYLLPEPNFPFKRRYCP
jgi:hypothetical protein